MKLKVIVILLGISSLVVAQSPYQQLADQIGVYLTAPEGIDTSACESFWFLKKGSPELDMNPLSISDGQRMFFEGLFPQADSKSLFEEALARCNIPDWAKSTPCAVTVSQIIEEAAIKAGLSEIENKFKDETQYGPTHEVEIAMRNLRMMALFLPAI